ncbi:histidine kinase dimerization/phosphoacceptor domain -containing protein [Parvularcula dongshanensis]|uniref:histidine kinase n=1 Tax=Parvularcula dongshanensis TaxID=1173995 RepID=A0A840I0E7_9PROT|nr:two-component sensor histidine kinase [Parvularcula dongshanensis]
MPLWLFGSVVLLGLFVLIAGWGLGADVARRIVPRYAAMVPSTAFSFVLTGGAAFYAVKRDGSRAARRALLIVAIAVAAIAATNIGALLLTTATGLDALLHSDTRSSGVAGTASATALCFLLASGALLRLRRAGARTSDLPLTAFATVGLVLSLTAATGYAFDTDALYEVSIFTAMALHTALGFAMLFSGLLLAKLQASWVRLLIGPGTGSAGARRLFPVIVALPFVLCLATLWLTRNGVFGPNFRLSVLAIVMTVVLAVAVLSNAARENLAEARQDALTRNLQVTIGERDLLLREVYHRVKNNLQQINGLLAIEAAGVDSEDARRAFDATSRRVQALGTVHRLLIASPSLTEFRAEPFLDELCQNLASGQDAAGRGVTVEVEAAEVPLPIDLSIALGLIVNELVTNALAHAFPDGGTVTVRLTRTREGEGILTVEDDGTGGAANAKEAAGTGTLIVDGLVRQLEASLTTSGEDGTRTRIVIPKGMMEGSPHV